jgi:hypothetical protein
MEQADEHLRPTRKKNIAAEEDQPTARVDAEGQAKLFSNSELLSNFGRGLRAIYIDAVREPIPEKFATLLKKIDQVQKRTFRKLRIR